MKKILIWVCTLCLLVTSLILSASAAVSDPSVYDRAGLLTDAEIASLTQKIKEAEAATGCDFYVVTHKQQGPFEYWGEDFLEDIDRTQSENIIVLIITLDRGVYYYDLYTYGNADDKIRSTEVDVILDDDAVYSNLKGGRLYEGSSAFIDLSAKAYRGRVGTSYLTIALISFAISAVIGLIACICVYCKYKHKGKSVDYPLDRFAKLSLTEQQDVFTGSFVTRRVIQTSSGSGGGRSGGGGRGGGGGHRGGR